MDDKSKRGEPDRSRINVNEPYEMQYWSEKLGLSQDKLKQIVAQVGPSVKDVEQALRG